MATNRRSSAALNPLARPAQGIYHVALGDGGDTDVKQAYAQFQQSLQDQIARNPASFGHVQFTQLSAEHNDIALRNNADLVLTFRNFRN